MRAVASAALLFAPTFATAGDILISDPYARSSHEGAKSGAAFMAITNSSQTDDRLVAASSGIAKMVELHTHVDQGNGVMKMVEIEGGIAIAPGATHMMERGGDHVMFMGLTEPFVQGEEIIVTLTFENAGEVVVTIPVDNERKPGHGDGHSMEKKTN
jgi:copper(I)-binding protein